MISLGHGRLHGRWVMAAEGIRKGRYGGVLQELELRLLAGQDNQFVQIARLVKVRRSLSMPLL